VSFLLDTNVVSEWVKPQPNPHVVAWLAEVDEDRVFLSVASLAEIRQGVELMSAGKRRDRLFDWLTGDLPARFEGRILDIDSRTAEAIQETAGCARPIKPSTSCPPQNLRAGFSRSIASMALSTLPMVG
jgi:predicted nucleic acid-binding protein